MIKAHNDSGNGASDPQDPYQILLPQGKGFDLVVDNAKSHSNFAMEWTRRSRPSLLSGETEMDREFRLRFEALCEDHDEQPTRRPLHPNASFPPANERRRRAPIVEPCAFDRWGASSDSEISYNHDETDVTEEKPPSRQQSLAPQRPCRRMSVDAEALSSLIASMETS